MRSPMVELRVRWLPAPGSTVPEARSPKPALDDGSRPNHAVFRHDDDAAADVIAIAVGLLDLALVDQLGLFADPRVLVDDDPVEYHVAADAEPRRIATCRRRIVCFVVV